MNKIVTETEINGREKQDIGYTFWPWTTPSSIGGRLQGEELVRSDIPTDIHEEFADVYSPVAITGEVERVVLPTTERIVKILESAITLIEEVLEVFGDEIERINTFSLFGEEIKSLWELREEANQNFVDVLVLLEVTVRNSHYQNYQKNQYESIKMVLGKIKGVHITPQQVKECRKLLMDNGIDLFAPIRDWENYTVEIKKNDAKK